MSTTGETLKHKLGLDNFKHVRISRVYNVPLKIYMIWFDSYRPDIPLERNRIFKNPRMTTLINNYRSSNPLSIPKVTPPIKIEKFNMIIEQALFITIDLAGRRLAGYDMFLPGALKNPRKALDIEESVQLDEEGFTISDYRKNALSNITKNSYGIRFHDGTSGSFLKEVSWSKASNYLLLVFETRPTFLDTSDKKATVGLTTKNTNFKRGKIYTVRVLFEDVSNWLGDRNKFLGMSPADQIDLLRVLFEESYAKVHSNDYSWYWQGGWENADKLGYSIFPFTGVHGGGEWSKRMMGEFPAVYITKHIYEVLGTIPFLTADIRLMIEKKYKSQ